jgi:hypothetical protein
MFDKFLLLNKFYFTQILNHKFQNIFFQLKSRSLINIEIKISTKILKEYIYCTREDLH